MALGFFGSTNDPAAPDSADALARKRRLIDALMMQKTDTSPVQHWTQGLARVLDSASTSYQDAKLSEKEAVTAKERDRILKAIGGVEGDPAASAPPITQTPSVNYAGGSEPGKPGAGGVGNFNSTVARTLQFEGGLNPNDSNGTPSNFGINQKANPNVDVASLTRQGATDIYKRKYWDAIGGDNLPPAVAHVAFDTAVIAGPGKAKELLAAAGGDPMKMLELRKQFQDSLIARDPAKYGPYQKSWNNRIAGLRADVSASAPAVQTTSPAQLGAVGYAPSNGMVTPEAAAAIGAAAPVRQQIASNAPGLGYTPAPAPTGAPQSPYGDLSGARGALSPYGDLSGARDALQPQPRPNPDVPAPAAGNVSSTPGQPDMIAQATAARAANPQPGDTQIPLGPNGALPPGMERLLGALEGSPEAKAMAADLPSPGANPVSSTPQRPAMSRQAMLAAALSSPALSAADKQAAMQLYTATQREEVRPSWGKIGTDADGHDVLGWINPKTMQVTPGSMNNGGPAKAPNVQRVKQPDGSEVAVQWDDKARKWVPLDAPGGGNPLAPPKMTEAQSKDVNLYNRGSKIIDRLEKQDGELTKSWSALGAQVPGAGNYLKTDSYRQAEQTGRELLAIILRKDTGAAVTDTEMEQYGQMYLPRPGDDPGTIKQKQEGRRSAIEGLKMGLGPGEIFFRQKDALDAVKAPPPAPADETPKRRKFNPATGAIE